MSDRYSPCDVEDSEGKTPMLSSTEVVNEDYHPPSLPSRFVVQNETFPGPSLNTQSERRSKTNETPNPSTLNPYPTFRFLVSSTDVSMPSDVGRREQDADSLRSIGDLVRQLQKAKNDAQHAEQITRDLAGWALQDRTRLLRELAELQQAYEILSNLCDAQQSRIQNINARFEEELRQEKQSIMASAAKYVDKEIDKAKKTHGLLQECDRVCTSNDEAGNVEQMGECDYEPASSINVQLDDMIAEEDEKARLKAELMQLHSRQVL